MTSSSHHPVAILGAGPAGISAALQLAKNGIDSLLLEKSSFPRDKICGDGLSGRALQALKDLAPEILQAIHDDPNAMPSYGVTFLSPNHKKLEIFFKDLNEKFAPGYVVRRRSFDNLLAEKARSIDKIDFRENTEIISIEKVNQKIILTSSDKSIFSCDLLLYAAGFNEKMISTLDPSFARAEKPGIGVRIYFSNVEVFHPDHPIEIHFVKELLPWYLWIFPLPGNKANVGLGLLHDKAKKSKISAKDLLLNTLRDDPMLKERFLYARMESPVEAARLPYYTGRKNIHGDHYMLTGDAAELIDPFTGEGIGNAIMSGQMAAATAMKCLQTGNFSSEMTSEYESLIYNKLQNELDLGRRLQNLARGARLLNLVIGKASKNDIIKEQVRSMIYNINNTKPLSSPLYYLKLLLKI